MPQFNVRQAEQINERLGKEAAPSGFVNVPIHTYIEFEWNDDLGYGSCKYSFQVNNMRTPLDSSYKEVLYTRDELAEPFARDLGSVFNVTAEEIKAMEWKDVERYSDVVFAEVYQGIPQKEMWTKDEWADVIAQLKASLVDPFTTKARKLDISHEIRSALSDIKAVTTGKATDLPKYRLYSAHDTNIANWLEQLNPTFKFAGIPFAANIYFELYKGKSGDHYVKTMYNGSPLKLEACGECPYCTMANFWKQMETTLYQGDLQEACDSDPTADYLAYLRKQAAKEKKFLA
jgi:hypothetical protein